MKVLRVIITAMIALAVVVNVTVASPTGDDIQKVVNSFVEHIDGLESVEADKKSRAQKVIGEVGKDSPDAITEGLIHLYPAYSQAIEMSDAEETDQAIDSLQELSQSNDKYLSADASFYLARTLMNAERFEEALPILQQLTGKLGQFSVHQGNSQYFIGVAQAGLLKNQDAIQSFMTFLSFNPDAPERLRVSAWRQAQELQSIQDGKLDDIYQRMDYSRRRLTLKETGDQTQGEQDKIVDLLTKLIKEEEKKECSSNCKKGGT
ncbi:MAG: tetratricopeptide repeat protein [Planctomycetota bacterium]